MYLLLDECLEIADDATGDVMRHVTKDGRTVERVDHESMPANFGTTARTRACARLGA
jgi:hypothetical protein